MKQFLSSRVIIITFVISTLLPIVLLSRICWIRTPSNDFQLRNKSNNTDDIIRSEYQYQNSTNVLSLLDAKRHIISWMSYIYSYTTTTATATRTKILINSFMLQKIKKYFSTGTCTSSSVGISFTRQIQTIPNGTVLFLAFSDNNGTELNYDNNNSSNSNSSSSTAMTMKNRISNTNHCSENDIYGNNNCIYNWGDTISVLLNATIDDDLIIVADDYIEAHVEIDDFIPFTIRCPLCGQDCKITIPVLEKTIIIPMIANCPISQNTTPIIQTFTQTIKSYCPFHDLPETILYGNIFAIQKLTGVTLATATFTVTIKC